MLPGLPPAGVRLSTPRAAWVRVHPQTGVLLSSPSIPLSTASNFGLRLGAEMYGDEFGRGALSTCWVPATDLSLLGRYLRPRRAPAPFILSLPAPASLLTLTTLQTATFPAHEYLLSWFLGTPAALLVAHCMSLVG
ncbi:hypothetical protein B0H11DRAFT_2284359 [Mycena galericulata]|nr:hypothetical protein B0H11DRAFT_2284359 [Mycena galericulata]